jgi:hypothetical protein
LVFPEAETCQYRTLFPEAEIMVYILISMCMNAIYTNVLTGLGAKMKIIGHETILIGTASNQMGLKCTANTICTKRKTPR